MPGLREVDTISVVSSGDVSASDVEICKTSLIVDQELLVPQNHSNIIYRVKTVLATPTDNHTWISLQKGTICGGYRSIEDTPTRTLHPQKPKANGS